MDVLFKNQHFGKHNLPMPPDFWGLLSHHVFSGPDEQTRSAVLKPSLSLTNNLTLKPDLSLRSMKAKTYFNKRQLKTTDKRFELPKKLVKNPAIARKRSIDLLTSRPVNLLEKFVKREINTETRNDTPNTAKNGVVGVGPSSGSNSQKQPQKKSRTIHDYTNVKRRSSVIMFGLRRDFSIEQKKPSKSTFSLKLNTLDERKLEYLKKTLSSMVTESVYLKDFFKLFNSYLSNGNPKYHYRSKSASRLKNALSIRMKQSDEYCLFSDYVFNLYIYFNIKKEIKTKVSYIMEKNVIHFSELDVKPKEPLQVTESQPRKHFAFNFLTVNKYLKEFSYSIKRFNMTGQVVYVSLQGAKTPKYKTDKIKVDLMVLTKVEPEGGNAQTGPTHVLNLKAANLFKKLVQHSVINEKHNVKKREIKTRLTNCLRKSFFYVKRDVEHKKMRDTLRSKYHFKTAGANRLLIDVNTMFKIPKTLDLENFSTSLKNDIKSATKNFRLKNFDSGSKAMLNPYLQNKRLNNYL